MFRTPCDERLNHHSVRSEILKHVTGPYFIGRVEYRQSAIVSHKVGQTAPALQQQIALASAETTMREHPCSQLQTIQEQSQQINTQFPLFNQKDYPQESNTDFAARPKQSPFVKKFLCNEMPRMIIKIDDETLLMVFKKKNIRRYLPWSELDLESYNNLDEKSWNLWRTYLYLLDKSKCHKFARGQQFQDQLQKSDRNHVIPEVIDLFYSCQSRYKYMLMIVDINWSYIHSIIYFQKHQRIINSEEQKKKYKRTSLSTSSQWENKLKNLLRLDQIILQTKQRSYE